MNQMLERLESFKAATIASFCSILAFTITNQFSAYVLLKYSIFNAKYINIFDSRSLLSAAIVLFSGFLFGVTYRYIVRDDNNFQLKAGGVMAFGLVRGLAQVNMTVIPSDINNLGHDALPLILLLAENIFLFGLAALGLDVAIRVGWVKPFKAGAIV
ncbi:hypothetical protein NIES4071_74390 [Calothrix sp. NIES-4071]|nr:hypothetical protein NIES4071_74390 [Calothrix sp. NIES-4071]BAZ61714.1 hypothetical protein NIES4105_74340 [Calothrix sp. NIES-4105]